MKYLYCPWQSAYAKNTNHIKENFSFLAGVFCTLIAKNQNIKEFVIARATHSFVIMNWYSYNAGHILIIPYAHKTSLHELTTSVRAELIECMKILIIHKKCILFSLVFFHINTYASEHYPVLSTSTNGNYRFQKILYKNKLVRITGIYVSDDGSEQSIPMHMIQQPYPDIELENIPHQKENINHALLQHPAFKNSVMQTKKIEE